MTKDWRFEKWRCAWCWRVVRVYEGCADDAPGVCDDCWAAMSDCGERELQQCGHWRFEACIA